MQLSWLRSPLQRLAAVVAGTAVVAGASVIAWHELSATSTGSTVYSGVQAATTNNGNGGTGNNGNGNGNTGANAPHTFTISGSLDDVYPGQGTGDTPAYVYLTVANTNNQDIRVTSLTLSVGDASPDCTAANLAPTTETVSFSVVVPKNSQLGGTTFAMPIGMLASAPDACQTARFPLTLSGTGTGPA
jgi:hypothetical protein